MRGARRGGRLARLDLGIIPAYAGSTKWAPLRERLTGDHPRVCGEHVLPVALVQLGEGIIPAYAGSTT